MGVQLRRIRIAFSLIVLLSVFEFCMSNNDTWTRNRDGKIRVIKKLKKDFRKLKKQEGALQLIGSENGSYEGNVEILHDGKWGGICDDEWDDLEARVVCRQLGFNGAIKATSYGHFGQARRRYWMDNVYCDGSEDEIAKCRFDGWGVSDCGNNEAAGVVCLHEEKTEASSSSISQEELPKAKIKDVHKQGIALRLFGGRVHSEGQVEIKLGSGDWSTICGDSWSILEAAVVCRQLGLGYASDAIQTNFFDNRESMPMSISGIECNGNEENLAECLHDKVVDCPGTVENVAGVICQREMADLVFDHLELMRTAHLEDRQLYWLQCAMEENCVASQAYKVQRETENWHLETRRLLRFTARILNAGTADFRPSIPKHLWEWHMCHMHYHSMEVFATFDVIDSSGNKVAEGHKASFCLEDNQCIPGVQPRYKCANYGDQGISVNCSDIYKHNIDCQWVDISELEPGHYTLKVAVNPEFKVGEMSFDNNAAICSLLYTQTFATVHSCIMGRP
ncbi:lysyl oxidase homolog 3A-like [Nylanderia fulva]|uniref:lysyl oxidase homolog 3A-like n=1 Tax=Nylanderia fulva TaxID=613905 RepID=UPI0010FAF27B|nr:lysyl oxidase homolog 3A-like [Nylanderia fulva]XP_029171467.1 lysyl oxidase homolog 3A-like [Nylanderia fulva]XP_029171468.1 lysyl oxidase homolog 3A-like [Nylanderia fulva]XP_029171469.1 lysyl oxidase homolog 3A-like [Nylanderia fulva]